LDLVNLGSVRLGENSLARLLAGIVRPSLSRINLNLPVTFNFILSGGVRPLIKVLPGAPPRAECTATRLSNQPQLTGQGKKVKQVFEISV
jgi:hypothetical protein